MEKYYKFEKEIAESVGIEGAIILQWIKDNETATYIKLEKVFSGLPFWTETDLVSHLLDLHQKGLLNVDLDKKRISKESNSRSKVLQINNKTTSRANIDNTWQPSEDVVEILTRSGINEDFINELIAEFVVYWTERPGTLVSYNSKFIEHVRLKWAQHSAEIHTKNEPSTIDSDWYPSDDCMDIIQMTGIEKEFVDQYLPEFILYWKEDGRAFVSWDVKFLDFIKRKSNFTLEDMSKEHTQKFDFYNPYNETDTAENKGDNAALSKLRDKYKI